MAAISPPASAAPQRPAIRVATGSSPDGSYRPDIQGLRAVAVILVLLFHAGVPGITGGYVGVDVFFVLSGFLITGLLIRERDHRGSTSIVGFYARRARRILPMATLVLLATVIASALLLGFIRAQVIATDTNWAAAFLANVHFAAQGTDYLNAQLPPSPVQQYWSLAIEEQFYVVWPTVFLLLARFSPRANLRRNLGLLLIVVAGASFAACVIETSSNATSAYFSPFCRSWELAAGALLATALPALAGANPPQLAVLSWLGLAGIVASALVLTSSTSFPGWAAALPVVATVAVIAGGIGTSRHGARALLGLRPVRWIGDISYSLYLWHWPLLIIVTEYVGHQLTIETKLILLAAAVGLSVVSYHLVENPFRYARALRSDALTSLMVGGCLIAITISADTLIKALVAQPSTTKTVVAPPAATGPAEVHALVAKAGTVRELPRELTPSLSQLPSDSGLGTVVCNTSRVTTRPKDCVYGDPNAARSLVLFGDSHAQMWIPAVAAAASRAHWKAILVARPGCPAPKLDVWDDQTQSPNHACNTWRSWAIAHVKQLRPSLIVETSMYFYPMDFNRKVISNAEWDKGFSATLSEFHSTGARTMVLGDTPYLTQNPPDCLAAHPGDVTACSARVATGVLGDHDRAERATATAAGASYINVVPWLCDATTCPAVIGRIAAYRDRAHVSGTYARWLASVMQGALRLG